ncbi:SRPBCC family protein [Halomarina ordinaria]|uniref:SRPBCC family protein n=1 Tax=Halomarina ordinaria TaxID=3033939 RepID=A0ABD5U6D2_9EURY|nr:SRPBCC family protein [Halomarina sp. PSRA2]
MAVFERETRVDAPFEGVWDFHSRIQGLEALTPQFMNLDVDRVVGPDGEENPETMEAGARAYSSVRPFGVGPRQRWVSVIVEREEDEDSAYFVDEMEDGPFPFWRHTHTFERDGEGTVVRDHVEYELPGGPLGEAAAAFGDLGFEPMFRYRHRKTRTLFEA